MYGNVVKIVGRFPIYPSPVYPTVNISHNHGMLVKPGNWPWDITVTVLQTLRGFSQFFPTVIFFCLRTLHCISLSCLSLLCTVTVSQNFLVFHDLDRYFLECPSIWACLMLFWILNRCYGFGGINPQSWGTPSHCVIGWFPHDSPGTT